MTRSFQRHAPTLQGGFALAIADDEAETSFGAPAPWPQLKAKLPLEHVRSKTPTPFTWEQTEYILGAAPVGDHGLILVGIPLPKQFSETVKQVEASQQRYLDLARERRLVRRTYMEVLLLAYRDGAFRYDLVRIISLQTGYAPRGRAGGSDAGDFSWTARLPRGSPRCRRNRRSGALVQPHG